MGIIVGALAGFAVTVVLTLVLPRRGRLALLRPVVAAILGLGAAYLVMRVV